MQRFSLFAIASLLVVACGGSDGGNHAGSDAGGTEPPQPRCGDGNVDVATETCDDGNTVSGDGCSATCQTETVNKCGNGHLDTGEACDDNNTTAGDGCSATCAVEPGYMCSGEPSTCTVMTPAADGTCGAPFVATLTAFGSTYVAMGAGDTTNATNQVAAGACDTYTSSGAGHDQIWKIVNPVAQPLLITIHHDSTTFDAVLRLTTTACDVTTQVPDDLLAADSSGHSDGCADLHGSSADERLNYTNLAAGTYYLVVDGYGATANGTYSFSVQAGTATCGNGVVELGETCDDGHTAPNDGCSATCQTESGYTCTGAPSVCTLTPGGCAMPTALTLAQTGNNYDGMGSGDTTNAANNVDGAQCDAYAMSGQGKDQVWTFTNPVAQAVTVTVTPASGFDAVLRVMTTACDLTTEVPETVLGSDSSATADGCADRHASGTAETLTYRNLPAGTYSVLVDGYSTTSAGTYTLAVHGEPSTCGNGTLELGESCDDHNTAPGDGCSATCTIEPGYTCTTTSPSVCTSTCGNGTLDTGEECDSGGVTDDRCTADCHLVFDTAETENNNDAAHAQVITPVHHIIEGSLPIGDLDVYQFTLTAPSIVEIETYTAYATSYTSGSVSAIAHLKCGNDTEAGIYANAADVADDSLAMYYDDDDGDGSCSYLGPLDSSHVTTQGQLAAGTYYFVVHEYNSDAVIPRYLVDFKVTPM
jgi:cysteine-rich repeat protein